VVKEETTRNKKGEKAGFVSVPAKIH